LPIKNFLPRYCEIISSLLGSKKEIYFPNAKFEKIVKIDESVDINKNRNLITVETVDSSGLLANISKVFFENDVSIYSARINTLGERVEDTFEIENFNKKLVPNYKIKKIISELKKVV